MPYKRKVQPAARLDTEGRAVRGVVQLVGRIYVVCREFNVVLVFEAHGSYARLPDIVVKDMKDPRDIAAFPATDQLFITDYDGDCVWRVDRDATDEHSVCYRIQV